MFAVGVVPVGFEAAAMALEGIKNGYPKAMTDAINRGLISGRKVAAQAISARYNLTSGFVKEAGFKIEKANFSKLKGSLTAAGPMLNVGLFGPTVKYTKGSKGPRRQIVSVTIVRGHKRVIKGAFRIPNGKIMERRQSERYPIHPVSTIGIGQMVEYSKIGESVQAAIVKQMNTRLTHNVTIALKGVEAESARVRMKAKSKLQAKEAA